VTRHDVDVAIVGAGPIGLYAAYYAGFRGMSAALVDSLPHPGGQVAALYPEKLIYDVAGHPAVKWQQLIDNLVAQVKPFDPVYLLGHNATTFIADGPGWRIDTHRGSFVRAGAVLIAAGIGTFTPRALPCVTAYENRGVCYHVPRLDAHRDRDVIVVGGGDSAVDWALALAPIARSVTLVHRRTTFRAHEHSVALLADSPVRVTTDAEVTACYGEPDLDAVDVLSPNGIERLPAQTLVAALGFTARLGPIAKWGLEIAGQHIRVDHTMRTSVPGIYAAGDVASYPGRVPLISVGFGEAATAVNHIAVALRPGAELAPGHSSDAPPVAVAA
jgi:thioredoxin reductase (NADPH)